MGAAAYKRMASEGTDLEGLWSRNLETKGLTYNRVWFESKISEYEKLL